MWLRIRTAIILVTIVGVAMFAFDSPYPFLALLAVGGSLAINEWNKMIPNFSEQSMAVMRAVSGVILGASIFISDTWVFWWILALLIWVIAISWIFKFPEKTSWYNTNLNYIGLAIFTASLTAMYYLWSQSPWWLMYVFVLVWCADSGAYFVGRKLGKKKMAPKVSPNKSMEGLYGGLATGLITVLLVSFIQLKYPPAQLIYFVVLSGITIIASVFGDLFESMLKRQAGIKDSGKILPGHGGILDRIDSLLSATPIFALGYWVMTKYL